MCKMALGIYGAGGLGREILDLARSINAGFGKWEKIFFIDDVRAERSISGADVLTFEKFKEDYAARAAAVAVAVGEPKSRRLLREKLESGGYPLQTLVHPTAFIGNGAEMGGGAIVQYGCFVSCNVQIGTNVLLSPNAVVAHDSTIGRDAVISSFVAISGACTIGECTYIGVGVSVKEKVSVGADAIVGMGAVVVRDIPENVIALGNPARAIKKNEDGRVFK